MALIQSRVRNPNWAIAEDGQYMNRSQKIQLNENLLCTLGVIYRNIIMPNNWQCIEKDISFICLVERVFQTAQEPIFSFYQSKVIWGKHLNMKEKKSMYKATLFVIPDSCYAVYKVVMQGLGLHVALLIAVHKHGGRVREKSVPLFYTHFKILSAMYCL